MQFQTDAICHNAKLLKKSDYLLKLVFHESLAIKDHNAELVKGIESCKRPDLVLNPAPDIDLMSNRDL